ncbi:yqaS [Parageobacillus genomosp. 1]|uniref:YqaS n=1 Tax=Parageobacillus genomosp. 1 TaxID=1295642 RepID=A0ABC9VGG4_9BACL|nr:phage terminase small subunit [Parageobacillus genomosp. 1]EZP77615.1 yqaS [Parageobacillus genomosp. 1]
MPRQRDPRRDEAFEIWKQHNGNITNREIAKMLGVDEKVVAVWKQRDKWNDVQQTNKNVVQQKKKHGGQPGNRGNPNPKNQFTKRNRAAVKHGFFSKYLPQESLDIMEEIQERSPIDLLWDQIMIQYAAIIRAQKIMFVSDQDDLTKELKKEKNTLTENMEISEREYEIQFAWDKHATFLNAQSRAMSELRSLIKQFEEMASMDDERRLKLEQMKLGIEKTKKETEFIEERTKQLKGAAKDTSLLKALIDVVKGDGS